ncbi:hypothetical protein GCM10023238_27980 [Streptomyces heliomycini]
MEIHELPHAQFQRRGDDLHCTVTSDDRGGLGTKVPLETLDGLEEVDIRPGTSRQSIPLHGRGVTHLRAAAGRLIVHVEVQTRPSSTNRTPASGARQAAGRGRHGQFQPGQQGLFSRLRIAFNGR